MKIGGGQDGLGDSILKRLRLIQAAAFDLVLMIRTNYGMETEKNEERFLDPFSAVQIAL